MTKVGSLQDVAFVGLFFLLPIKLGADISYIFVLNVRNKNISFYQILCNEAYCFFFVRLSQKHYRVDLRFLFLYALNRSVYFLQSLIYYCLHFHGGTFQ